MEFWSTDKVKQEFFRAEAVLVLLYGCTTWTLTKHLKKKVDENYVFNRTLSKKEKKNSYEITGYQVFLSNRNDFQTDQYDP